MASIPRPVETAFEQGRDLDRLPWFDRGDDGRLRLADRSAGPIVDVHTHLALGFGGPLRVDVDRAHPRTRHYLPLDGPLDLEVYANRNFTDRDLARIRRDLGLLSTTPFGLRRSHTAPNLVREMDDLGIHASVLLPIEGPLLSRNAERYLETARDRDRLVSFGSVHPFAPGAADRLERQRDRGARGVKIHPGAMLVSPDHPRAMALYPVCADLGLPVLFHAGPVGIETALGRRLSQMKNYWRPAAENPGTTFILGHTGALQMEMALELANRYPNCWLELASQSLPNVRRILAEGPRDRICLGSDWPFYHQSMVIAKVLLATEGDPSLRRAVLRENACRLLDLTVAETAPGPDPGNRATTRAVG